MPLHPDRHVTPGGRPIRRVAVAAGGADRPGHLLGPKPNLRGWGVGGGGQFQRPAGVNKWPVSSRGAPLVYVSSLEELGGGDLPAPPACGFLGLFPPCGFRSESQKIIPGWVEFPRPNHYPDGIFFSGPDPFLFLQPFVDLRDTATPAQTGPEADPPARALIGPHSNPNTQPKRSFLPFCP